MPKALLCQIDPDISSQLKQEMKQYGWNIDACEGMLEMLRMLECNEYEMVILSLTLRTIETRTRVGAIKALEKNPKILLNLAAEDLLPSSLMLEYPVIKGALTPEKVLEAARDLV